MARSLRLLFRRDPSRDRQDKHIHFEGYEFLWPDGRPVTLGLDAFCKHGQRLLGLGRHLRGASERLVDLLCFPLADMEAPMTKLPGHRVRRFSLQRHDRQGRLYFLDGTPTTIVLDLDRDDARVLHWIGLPGLRDGESQWFDLAARPVESAIPKIPTPTPAFSVHPLPHDAVP